MRLILTIIILFPIFLYTQEVVINEVMVSVHPENPEYVSDNDSSLNANSLFCTYPDAYPPANREWIELYNPNPCDTVDISGYILANVLDLEADGFGGDYYTSWGAFCFPPNSKIPPLGFIIVGGNKADVPYLDYNTTYYHNNTNYLIGGDRWFLTNVRGWIGIYNKDTWPVDILCWGLNSDDINSIYEFTTPVPINFSHTGQMNLLPPVDFSETYILQQGFQNYDYEPSSFRRTYDGSTEWIAEYNNFTPRDCNNHCVGLPIPEFDIKDVRCASKDGSIKVKFPDTISLSYEYSWDYSGNIIGDSLTNLDDDIYLFVVRDDYKGCIVEAHYPIVESYDPGIVFDFMNSPDNCNSGTGSLGITNMQNEESPLQYVWSTENEDTTRYISNLYKGNYTVTVTDKDSCITTQSIFLDNGCVVSAPNTITPNSDGMNDTWEIKNIWFYPDHRLEIFDRYGHLVYATKDYQNDWHGQKNDSSLLPAATYYFILNIYSDNINLKGSITVIR